MGSGSRFLIRPWPTSGRRRPFFSRTAGKDALVETYAANDRLAEEYSCKRLLAMSALKSVFDYFRTDLAVDLGTANMRVGIPGEGVVLDEPSTVAVDKKTGRVLSDGLSVGYLARQMQGRAPDSILVARPLQRGAIANFRLCETMLRTMFGRIRKPGWSLSPRVLVSLLDSLTPVERQAALNCLARSGAGSVWTVSATAAAAIGAGLPVVEPSAGMVCLIGAGATEAAVFSLGNIVARQSLRIGCDDFDQAVVDYLRRRRGIRVGLAAAEALRMEIGDVSPVGESALTTTRAAEVSGTDVSTGLPFKTAVAADEIRQALAEPLDKIADAIRQTLDPCGPELAADLIEEGMVLCGGGALTTGLSRFIAVETGVPARMDDEPLTTVVRGLLVCLDQFDKWRPMLRRSEEVF